MNVLYTMTQKGSLCTPDMIDTAIKELLDFSSDTYETLLYQMPEKQRALFIAIASAGKAKAINGSEFVRKYHLSSASSVASAAKGLLEKDFITNDKGVFKCMTCSSNFGYRERKYKNAATLEITSGSIFINFSSY